MCICSVMDTHRLMVTPKPQVRSKRGRSSLEGKLIPLLLLGNYRLWKHSFTWQLFLKGANGHEPPTNTKNKSSLSTSVEVLSPGASVGTQREKSRPKTHLHLSAAGSAMERWVTVWKITLLFRLSRQHLLCKHSDLQQNDACCLCPYVQTATLLLCICR